MKELTSKFGARLRAARNDLHLSMRSAAALIGISVPYLSFLETNRNGDIPSLPILKSLSHVLGIPLEELLTLSKSISHRGLVLRATIEEQKALFMIYCVARKHNISLVKAAYHFASFVDAKYSKEAL